MKKVTHCDIHSRYTPGCEGCKEQVRIYRKQESKRNDDTHYNNGQPKRQGIYSEENWKRFNALGRALTNEIKEE